MGKKVWISKKQYEINGDTIGLLPFYNEFGDLHTKVMERNRTLCIDDKPKNIIKYNCCYYGSSYQGRKDGTLQIMGYRSIAPIVISEQLGIFFIPLESPSNDTCIWLAQSHVKRVQATSSDRSDIIFSNDTFISVNQAKNTLETKIHRATHYRFVLEWRIQEKKTPYSQSFFTHQ